MRASLRALLEGLIDYAGLFPPARLPLAEALANYQSYRAGTDAWMLGRFVCPAARLKEIPMGIHLACSALGRGGGTPDEFLAGLEADLADIAASHVRVEVLEVKLPPSKENDRHLIEATGRRLEGRGIPVFFEPPSMARSDLMPLFTAVADQPFAGCKFRAGGVSAASFPSSEQLAFALCFGVGSGRPVKATAGLHHPFPRFDPDVEARMHGFVNVFAAGVLLSAGVLPGQTDDGEGCDNIHRGTAVVRALLEDADPSHFAFTERGLRWRDFAASLDQIRDARRAAVLSFGSCSFDEPRDDLRALGWL